jgi:uncharacterized protein (DUF885 family)
MLKFALRFAFGVWLVPVVGATEAIPAATRATAEYVPADVALLAHSQASELRELVERFVADRDELQRFYDVRNSERQLKRMREFYAAWRAKIDALPFDTLGVEGRIDATLLRNRIDYDLRLLERQARREAEMAPLLPFAVGIANLQESRRLLEPVDAKAAGAKLDELRRSIENERAELERTDAVPSRISGGTAESEKSRETTIGARDAKSKERPSRIAAFRAANRITELQATLDDWFKFYDGYDPDFSWWTRTPHRQLSEALEQYRKFLREKVVGIESGKDEPIIGDPIGRDGLQVELDHEMISYTPEQLIDIATRELAWCDAEWKRVAHELGCGDDWKATLEKVKSNYVVPGRQPTLVRDLALEAIRFVQERDLVTVPPVAADFWQMKMLTPDQQKTAPFFLGGEDILVAYPTESMDQAQKLMSLRANNVHFARATVFHELVPGHHLQSYYETRANPHRQLFTTPFWIEGWSLWWEFYLWDLNFPRSPEDRVGMLFWRTHRCARIIFSLNFHLGKWTPQQCVDFLVERVGHERASAEGEVRRSFNGDYSPLYQVGYMMGALQIRALHQELVGAGKMTDRAFHDAIMQGGPMPIEMVRARLEQTKLPRDFRPTWKFYDLK